VGLSTYLYLPLRASLNCAPSWGYPINLPLFYWVVSRQLVAGMEPWIQNFSFYFESISEIVNIEVFYWLPGFVLLVLIGMRTLWIKEKKITLSLFLIFGPIFLGVWAIHQQKNIYLIQDYLIPLAGLMILFGFLGCRSFLLMTDKKSIHGAVILALTLASVVWLFHVFQVEDKNEYLLAEDFGENIMKSLPQGAILLAEGDHYVMPIWYEKFVNQKRPDLIFEPRCSFFTVGDGSNWRINRKTCGRLRANPFYLKTDWNP
jgi:hypothetical protein